MEVSGHQQEAKEVANTSKFRKTILIGEASKPSEDRIVMLSDGVFAIAVTLLVLSIQIPDINLNTVQAHAQFNSALTDIFFRNTLFYVITFAALAAYWLNHRHLTNVIKRVDRPFLSLNLLFLAFVAFFPVASNLLKYSKFPEAVIVYTVVLAGCGYSAVLLWIYALGNYRLVAKDSDVESSKSRIIGVAITPTFFLASLFLLFIPTFPPGNIFYFWLLLPLMNIFWTQTLKFYNKRRVSGGEQVEE